MRFHRIKGLEKLFKTIQSNHSLAKHGPQHHISTSSKHFQRWGFKHISLGSLFQSMRTLSVNKLLLRPNQNLSWCNQRLFPILLSIVPREKRPIPTWPWPPKSSWERKRMRCSPQKMKNVASSWGSTCESNTHTPQVVLGFLILQKMSNDFPWGTFIRSSDPPYPSSRGKKGTEKKLSAMQHLSHGNQRKKHPSLCILCGG